MNLNKSRGHAPTSRMSRRRGRRHRRVEASRTGRTTLPRRERRSSLTTQIARSEPQRTKRMAAPIRVARDGIMQGRPRVLSGHQRTRTRAALTSSAKCSTRSRSCSPMAARSSWRRTPTRRERLASKSWQRPSKSTSRCRSC